LATPEQISALTQRIRESIKISDDYIYDPDMYKNLETASQEVEADQTVAITLPKFSKPLRGEAVLHTWNDLDTEKLIQEITTEALLDLESIEGPYEEQERLDHYADIENILVDSKGGLFGGRGYGNADYVETSPEYAGLGPIYQSSFKAVVKFEDLIKKNGKTRTNLNFKQDREQQYIEEFLEQEIISPEIYDALQGRGTKFIDDGIQEEAAALMNSLIRKESELTTSVLKRSPESTNFRSAIGKYVTAANPNDIRSGIFNDIAGTLPLVENIIRDQIEQGNLEAMREAFATNANLANAVTDILGPVMVATDDEDKIEANTRKRLINYLESFRTSLKTRNPNFSDQDVGRALHSALMEARSKGPVDEAGMPGQSLIDQMRNQEIGIVTDKKATDEYEAATKKFNKEKEAADKAEMKRLQGASASDGLAKAKEYLANQFTLDTTISAEGLNTMAAEWYQQQQDALARGEYATSNSEIFGQFDASILGPGGFIDQGWADQAIENPALMYETYTDPNDPSQQLNVSDAANRSGYQMAPNGRVGQAGTRWDPVLNKEVGGATYIDPNTGQIAVDQNGIPIRLKGKEILENAHLVDPLTLFNYYRTMDMSPGEIENMGMGGAPPAFPVQDFSAFLPDQGQLTKGDMYTTDAFGNKIPYYPYGDPSDPVPGRRAFPGYQGTDYERFEQFLPGYEAPDARYDQALKRKDTVLPSQDQFLETGSESYFDLGPTEQGEISPPPEPVNPISAIDFMALSEPEF
tara:strand:+ start:227 stop:2485 length:2259 start_codon:yes stop_codon:yes gene_type:complete